MHAIRPLVLAVIASAVALTATQGPAEAGFACKPMAYGKGVSIRKSYAGHIAITKWSALVQARHGRAYAAFPQCRGQKQRLRPGQRQMALRRPRPPLQIRRRRPGRHPRRVPL